MFRHFRTIRSGRLFCKTETKFPLSLISATYRRSNGELKSSKGETPYTKAFAIKMSFFCLSQNDYPLYGALTHRSHHRKHRSWWLEVSAIKRQNSVNSNGKYGNKKISTEKVAIRRRGEYEKLLTTLFGPCHVLRPLL